MITQSTQSLKLLVETFENKIGVKVRMSLRQLGILHIYRHKEKLYTFDVPFQLVTTKDGEKILVVINKANLPRKYLPEYLRNAKGYLESTMGMSAQIIEAHDLIAVCYKIPKNTILSTVI